MGKSIVRDAEGNELHIGDEVIHAAIWGTAVHIERYTVTGFTKGGRLLCNGSDDGRCAKVAHNCILVNVMRSVI